MEKPILLTKDELVLPIKQALERIEKIRQRKIDNEDEIILEGLFALSVASFEHSLNDSLKILLSYIPEKLKLKSEHIPKEDLINGDPLEFAIEREVRSISYNNLTQILKYYADTTGIEDDFICRNELDKMTEIKATRNLLMHNNLVVNNDYLETSGPNRRGRIGQRLKVNQEYLYNSLATLRNILRNIEEQLSRKYASYTKIEATKNLFKYIFRTPIMVFENEFNIVGDEITGVNPESRAYLSLSSSERFFYDFWVAHSDCRSFQYKDGSIYGLDGHSRKKLAFLISALDILK